MEKREIIAVFYQNNELDIKDIDREIFTKEKKIPFHLFFFHNKNLHFDKNLIAHQVLIDKFENLEPEIKFSDNQEVVTLTKTLDNFNCYDFNNEVDHEYELYLNKINFRITSIFETFTLFCKLYHEKSLIFIFPNEIREQFYKILEKTQQTPQEINKDDKKIKKYDVYYWVNYFSRLNHETPYEGEINDKNILTVFEIL